MNKLLLFIVLFFSFSCFSQQLKIKGVYRGKNVYIQNPYNSSRNVYCIQSIVVNGSTTSTSPASSALTIDLSHLALNDSVTILVFHYAECLPKILNPRVLHPGSGFSIIQPTADNASVSWITTGEIDKNAIFEVEKMYLNGWQSIAKVKAKGDIDNNQYSIGVVHYAGQNEFRIHYISKNDQEYSDTFEFYSAADPISFFPIDDVDELISLSKPTDYLIKDSNGKVYKKGYGQDIYVEDLKPGEYILVIENREEAFFKPEPKDY